MKLFITGLVIGVVCLALAGPVGLVIFIGVTYLAYYTINARKKELVKAYLFSTLRTRGVPAYEANLHASLISSQDIKARGDDLADFVDQLYQGNPIAFLHKEKALGFDSKFRASIPTHDKRYSSLEDWLQDFYNIALSKSSHLRWQEGFTLQHLMHNSDLPELYNLNVSPYHAVNNFMGPLIDNIH